jgi:predicted permease
MSLLRVLAARLVALFRKGRLERELDEELRSHMEMLVEKYERKGMSLEEARLAARQSFGGVEQVKEAYRDRRGIPMIESLLQDLRFGLRMLAKNPGFTAVAVLSLALGIGANTAVFSVADSVLLRTLPVKDPDRLVLFEWQAGTAFRTTGISGYSFGGWPPGMYGNSAFHTRILEALREQDGPLSDLFAFANLWDATIVVDGQAERADAQLVSGGYYAGLGVPALLGRTITEADDNPTGPPVAVMSYRYWRDRFGADPGALGKQITINQVSFTLIGVTPPNFTGTLQVDSRPVLSVPLAVEPMVTGDRTNTGGPDEPARWWIHLMGRLEPGATLEQARDSLNGVFQSTALELMPPPKKASEPAQLDPKDYPSLLARPGSRGMTEARQRYSTTIFLLFGVVGLVLLVACANVANMLLARSAARRSEIAVRLAVGAGRWRLVRQLVTESLLLSALGGVVGVGFALWGAHALAAMSGARGSFLPAGVDYGLSWPVLGFTVAVSLLTGSVFGLAPAWRATRLDLTTALKEGSRGSGGVSRSWLNKALVVAQVAMSLVLLVGAGLLVRTVHNLQQVDVGFTQEGLLVFTIDPGTAGYKDERLEQFYRQVFARLDANAGVRSATFAHVPLVAHRINQSRVILPGETARSEAEHFTNRQIVRENYFETMEIPLLRGRGFAEQDGGTAPKVVIVSETFARKYFPDQDPVGQRIKFNEDTESGLEIVGVTRDIKYNRQREEFEPLAYTPWLQEGDATGRMSFALRAAGDPTALVPAVREIVREVDPNLPVTDVMTQVAQARETFAEERVLAGLLSFFGALALLLAAIGLYGVMAYSVAQRTHEIGIRMALGAQVATVLRLVIGQGLTFVAIGLMVGALAALALKRVVESQLYGVGAADPLTFTVVGASLMAAALVACWIPARRATKVDPAIALRNE